MRFMAMVIVSCASGESEPSDMADETNRARMDSMGSTSSSGIGDAGADGEQVAHRRRRAAVGALAERAPRLVGRWHVRDDARAADRLLQRQHGLRRPRRAARRPCGIGAGRRRAARRRPRALHRRTRDGGAPARPRPARGSPGRRAATPCRRNSGRSLRRPGRCASNICAPQYEDSVEMPILARILSSPFSIGRAVARLRLRRPRGDRHRRRAAAMPPRRTAWPPSPAPATDAPPPRRSRPARRCDAAPTRRRPRPRDRRARAVPCARDAAAPRQAPAAPESAHAFRTRPCDR